ncbi:MAG: LysM peptidoglycan-binding domain-containing protein [Alphaproteobacteria bacterium]|nr:LysM peptidoglycan-binding domain-containing protein [Alphaproteobacteria bacterium]
MTKKANMGKIKRSTDDMIDDAIAQQNDWQENRRTYTRGFLKSLNMFARPSAKKVESQSEAKIEVKEARNNKTGVKAYWFPIMCALFVIFMVIWLVFIGVHREPRVLAVPNIPEPTVQQIKKYETPSFDIVRIQHDGSIVVAGRWKANTNVSVLVNNKVVSTQRTDENGEFVYAPTTPFAAGNYTFALLGTDPEVKSDDKVFVYVSEHGYKNSLSLLMTKDGSTLLQGPYLLKDGDLTVSKIDYLDSGRMIVTGTALPRLRVSMILNHKYLGFARVSDYRNFGLGADIGDLEPGKEYELIVRLHDGAGRTVANIIHKFTAPEMTGDDDTFYTVRRGDCLWVIARNFMRRGILFSIIAERNNIENPDLIFPKQKLQIPVIK